MLLAELEPLFKLNAQQEAEFDAFVRETRKSIISNAKETAKRATQHHADQLKPLLDAKQISQVIYLLREQSYEEFLKEEAAFNAVILGQIGQRYDIPKNALDIIAKQLKNQLVMKDSEHFVEIINQAFGEFAGFISAYIYRLCLSNTQSRRSRAGKTFEGIIYYLYEYYGYAFESQSSIGRKSFDQLGLGKVVDSILPSTEAFNHHRQKTIVGSMKTTLRERWQEVVEEVSRSNLPNIYLLTVDDDISISKAEQMAMHNITLVVPENIKQQEKLKSRRNIISFETYFFTEIPNVLAYWHKEN